MPPKIALLLCLIFILYLFKNDFSRKSDVSHALWIPLIWLILLSSRPIGLWLNLGATSHMSVEELSDGSFIDRLGFSMLIVAGVFILARRKIYWSQILKGNTWLLLFFLYCAISITWSDFPYVSFKRYIKEIGSLVMVLIVLTDPDPVEAIKTMIRRSAYVLIPLSVLFIKYYRHLGVGYSGWGGEAIFKGVAMNKNTLGRLCLVSGFYFFWNIITLWRVKNVSLNKKELYIHIFLLLSILWLLNKANSATSLISLIIGVCVWIGLGLPIFKKNAQYIGWYILLILVFISPFVLMGFETILSSAVESSGHSDTFLGRTILWEKLLNMGTDPSIGTGFRSFWTGDRMAKLWMEYWWRPTEAHNGYIETYLNLGFIGLFLLVGVIFSAYRNICRKLKFDFEYGRFNMALLVIALLYNITEAAFGGLHLIWFIFLLIAINYNPFQLNFHNYSNNCLQRS